MQAEFEQSYAQWRAVKSNHFILSSEAEYVSRVEVLRKVANGEKPVSPEERNWITRYTLNERFHLLRSNRRVLIKSQLFEILHEAHIRFGHGGRDVMYADVCQHFHGVSKEIILLYLDCCQHCELKKAKAKKGVVVKPIHSNDYNERCQVDLIDMQSRPDGDFRFIFVYQCHFTKFVILRALKTKSADAVALHLIDIFTTFGAPKILQSDNGREFENKVVRAVVAKWPECRIVHGKPRHSQSQGSVERANRDIGDILTIYLRENNTTEWASALPFVQAKKNQRFHRAIKRSPYEALFGHKFPVGGQDAEITDDTDETGTNEQLQFVTIDGTSWINGHGADVDRHNAEDDNGADVDLLEEAIEAEEQLNQLYFQRQAEREGAGRGQAEQAAKMLESSNNRYSAITAGTSVRIAVPDVDRSKIDPRNLMGVVTKESNGFYTIGTTCGILRGSYSRNQLEPCTRSFLEVQDVPDKEITLRSAVGSLSVSGETQGQVHCLCARSCNTMRCSCKRSGRLCNSRCHSSRQCTNKYD